MHRLLIPAFAGAMITLSLSCAKNSQTQAREQEVSTQNPTVSVSEQIDAGAQPKGGTAGHVNDNETRPVRIYCRSSFESPPSSGGLIQTAEGTAGGLGLPLTKRSGFAA